MIRRLFALLLSVWSLSAMAGLYEDALDYIERGRPARAADLLEEVAYGGHAEAQFLLGKLFLDGEGVRPDPQRAVTWLERAVANGSREAALMLGNIYNAGLGVAADAVKGAHYLQRAADLLEPEEDDGSDCE